MSERDHSQHARILAEQLRTLFSQTPAAIIAHLFDSMVVVVLLWSSAPRHWLLGWLGMFVVASTTRIALSRHYLRVGPMVDRWLRPERMAVAVLGAFGLIWGLGILLFLDMGDPVSVIVMTTVVVGLNGGAASTLASYPPSLFIFMATTYLPLFWVFISDESPLGIALGALVAITVIAHTMICLGVNRVLERSLRLGFENEALRIEAEQANAAKTRFLASASHDLRQPVHALGLSFSILADKVDAPANRPLIDQVERSIEAVGGMLDTLLDISKLDAGVVKPHIRPLSVAALFQRLENEFSHLAREQGNRLRIRPSRHWALSDPDMLERILRNLLSNALRYTRDGRVLLAARLRGGRLRLEVWDTGIGIPEGQLEEIFVEYHQLANPQRDRRQGLGLGLAIVKRLAKLLEHPMGVTSIPGRGSCFWVQVPLAESQPAAGPGSATRTPSLLDPLQGARILVLDDETAILESMCRLLEHWGCKVDAAATIEEAEAAVRARVPDLLIVDYRLPGSLTGLEAKSGLSQLAGRKLPALVITGDTSPERLREARDSGYPLLHKPVKSARLRSAVRNLLLDAVTGR